MIEAMGALHVRGDDVPCKVINKWSKDISTVLLQAFAGVRTIALDLEGVDLGRRGKTSIVQISTEENCFLLDVLQLGRDDPLITWLRKILQDPSILKIIHDCRMDADALWHIHNIKLSNVHDTSAWHECTTGSTSKNLNDTLSHHGLSQNTVRDSSVYRTNHAYWAVRPLTQQMIDWASGDVICMFDLHRKQTAAAESACVVDACRAKSEQFLRHARDMRVVTLFKVPNVGLFIGRGGGNLRRLQSTTGTLCYSQGQRSQQEFVVYHNTDDALRTVLRQSRGKRV